MGDGLYSSTTRIRNSGIDGSYIPAADLSRNRGDYREHREVNTVLQNNLVLYNNL